VPFSTNSTTLHRLQNGDTNTFVISCTSNGINIGDFYICYANHSTDLAGLDVDNCCYCSEIGAQSCSARMPNWKLEFRYSTCKLYLSKVSTNDTGFYQCRVYNDRLFQCKYRYGNITNITVSQHAGSQHDILGKYHTAVISAGIVLISLVVIVISCVVWKYKQRSRWRHQSMSAWLLYMHCVFYYTNCNTDLCANNITMCIRYYSNTS